MRLYELQAGEKEQVDTEAIKISEILSTECSAALGVMQRVKLPLYRGYATQQLDAFKGMSRNNRQPLSFGLRTSELLDDLFISSGFKALRSNSIYCSSRYNDAALYTSYIPGDHTSPPKEYTRIYYIFPVNGFNFTWSRKTGDLYGMWGDQDDKLLKAGNGKAIMDRYKFTDKNFIEAVKSGYEVLISGTYYAFNVEKYKHIIEPLINGVTDFGPQDDELLSKLNDKT